MTTEQPEQESEPEFDYWSLSTADDGRLDGYVSGLRSMDDREKTLVRWIATSTSIAVGASVWLAQMTASDAGFFKSIFDNKTINLIGFAVYIAFAFIATLRVYPWVLSPQLEKPNSFQLVKTDAPLYTNGNGPMLRTKAQWRSVLIDQLARRHLQLTSAEGTLATGLVIAIVIQIAAIVGALLG